MNCDQVFDVLTRGPFPTGGSIDAEVELHLTICHECARLAAALRPAIELFREAVGADEGRDLPGYWGEVAVEAAEPTTVCDRPQRRSRRRAMARAGFGGEITGSPVIRLSMAAIFVLFAAAMFHSASLVGKRSPRSAPFAGAARPDNFSSLATAPDDRSRRSIRLPIACLSPSPQPLPEKEGRLAWVEQRVDLAQCCTQCHNATQAARVPASATADVQQKCRLCHELN